MRQTMKLLLPALIPSWRFFDEIAPSPRIEFALHEGKRPKAPALWREFRPRPEKLTALLLLWRMVWNPRWNEALFLVSCAERLMANPTEHSREEIRKRICAELRRTAATAPYMQFRLIFLARNGEPVEKHVLYTSPIYPCLESPDP